MSYFVKEIFYTLQGEGHASGRPAVFCRFARCNLWSGREKDRMSAHTICKFCDTDFVGTDGEGGGKFKTAAELAAAVRAKWKGEAHRRSFPYVVCTGGEPLLQLDKALVEALHAQDFTIAIETNGTLEPPEEIDWICVSPKAGAPLVLTEGDELKLVYPQMEADPTTFEHLQFSHFYLQPMDGPDITENVKRAVEYCKEHPQWHLSLQTHKYMGIP